MGFFFKGVIKKATLQNLHDFKAAVERKSIAAEQRHAADERPAPRMPSVSAVVGDISCLYRGLGSAWLVVAPAACPNRPLRGVPGPPGHFLPRAGMVRYIRLRNLENPSRLRLSAGRANCGILIDSWDLRELNLGHRSRADRLCLQNVNHVRAAICEILCARECTGAFALQ